MIGFVPELYSISKVESHIQETYIEDISHIAIKKKGGRERRGEANNIYIPFPKILVLAKYSISFSRVNARTRTFNDIITD